MQKDEGVDRTDRDEAAHGPERTQARGGRTGFDALDVAVDFVETLAPVLERVQARDKTLADQTRRAAQSLVLNVAEGRKRQGKDRQHCFRVASGSGEETRAALRIARAWRYAPDEALERPLELLDRVLAMVWRLSR
jgi:four helix bundle protein